MSHTTDTHAATLVVAPGATMKVALLLAAAYAVAALFALAVGSSLLLTVLLASIVFVATPGLLLVEQAEQRADQRFRR